MKHDYKLMHQSNAPVKPVYTLSRALVDGAMYYVALLAIVGTVVHVALYKLTGVGIV